MGGMDCPNGDHIRKWDTISKQISDDEHWILVSKCYHCGDEPYWEVYLFNEDDYELLPPAPIRTEPYNEDS